MGKAFEATWVKAVSYGQNDHEDCATIIYCTILTAKEALATSQMHAASDLSPVVDSSRNSRNLTANNRAKKG
jgi:hypothetical protein